jgi:hypothetical protein
MNNYFTVKVKCSFKNKEGIFKRKVYSYLVSAYTFSEAETIIYSFYEYARTNNYVTDLSISSIQRSDYHDIFENYYSEGYCLVKISFDTNEELGSKKTIQKILVTADNIEEATSLVMEKFAITTLDYKIESVSSSPIVDVLTKDNTKLKELNEKKVQTDNLEEEELVEPIILNK